MLSTQFDDDFSRKQCGHSSSCGTFHAEISHSQVSDAMTPQTTFM